MPDVQGGCTAHGGVRVNPCLLVFNGSNPGPQTVTVRTPQGNGTLVETDTCASQGIATVTQNPSNPAQWIVTAGSTMGTCFAHFKYRNSQGKKVGHALLKIVNQL